MFFDNNKKTQPFHIELQREEEKLLKSILVRVQLHELVMLPCVLILFPQYCLHSQSAPDIEQCYNVSSERQNSMLLKI